MIIFVVAILLVAVGAMAWSWTQPWRTASRRFPDTFFLPTQDITSFNSQTIRLGAGLHHNLAIGMAYSNVQILPHVGPHMLLESYPAFSHGFIICTNSATLYVFDHGDSAQQLTIHVPQRQYDWLFGRVSISLGGNELITEGLPLEAYLGEAVYIEGASSHAHSQ